MLLIKEALLKEEYWRRSNLSAPSRHILKGHCTGLLKIISPNVFGCSPCGAEAPYELQYTPEGQGMQTEREWAPVWLLKVPTGHG